MLVLARRIGERIVIDDQIIVEVLQVKGNRIRLGIQAPSGFSVLREELLPLAAEDATQDPLVGDPIPLS